MTILLPLFGLSLSLSISAALIVAALLLIRWVWLRDGGREPSPVLWPVSILFLWTVFTALVKKTTDVGDALSSQSAYLLAFWAAHQLDREKTRKFFTWCVIGGAVAGLLGLLQHLTQINYRPDQKITEMPDAFRSWPAWLMHLLALRNDRAVGPRSHPLTYAECFIPVYFLALSALVRAWRDHRRSFARWAAAIVPFALIAGGVVFAQGRAVWIGLLLGTAVFGWFAGRRFFMGLVLALAVVSVPVLLGKSDQIKGRLMSSFSTSEGTSADQQSRSIRFALWHDALSQIREHPWIGVGYKGAELRTIDPVLKRERIWTETHNMFLQAALEEGLIGLGFFIWTLVVCARMVGMTPPLWRPAFAGMFVAFLLAGLTESWPRDKEVAMMFWVFMGCAGVLRRYEL